MDCISVLACIAPPCSLNSETTVKCVYEKNDYKFLFDFYRALSVIDRLYYKDSIPENYNQVYMKNDFKIKFDFYRAVNLSN